MRRQVYVTPKIFLSFIKSFKSLYQIKYEELDYAEKNFKIGLNKIKEAKDEIAILSEELKVEEEKLSVKKEQVDKLIVALNKEKDKAL